MKFSIQSAKTTFSPITLNLLIETEDELAAIRKLIQGLNLDLIVQTMQAGDPEQYVAEDAQFAWEWIRNIGQQLSKVSDATPSTLSQ